MHVCLKLAVDQEGGEGNDQVSIDRLGFQAVFTTLRDRASKKSDLSRGKKTLKNI